ncbi:MAG: sugar ABC transporter permease [Spirochaetales bacterium]
MKNTMGGRGWPTAILFLLPSAVGLLVFSLLPIVASFGLSLTTWDGLVTLSWEGLLSSWVGLGNYSEVLGGEEFWKVLGNTVYFIVLYVPMILGAALAVSLLLNARRRGASFYRVLYYIPVLTSWVAGALIWKWILSPQYGLLNLLLGLVGITGPGWLSDTAWAMPGIVLTSLWKDVGFFSLIVLGGLANISPTYYEAADLDGASTSQKFFRVTLPLLTPVLFLVMVITLINSFQLFPQIMVMTTIDGMPPGQPQGATQVMVERIYTYAFKYYKMGLATAWSWLLFVIIFGFTWAQLRIQSRWVNYDA